MDVWSFIGWPRPESLKGSRFYPCSTSNGSATTRTPSSRSLSDRFPERDPRELLTRILSLDEQRRATIQQLQEAQARRNAASKEIGQAMAAKDTAKAEALKTEVAALKTAIQDGEAEERRLEAEFSDLLATIPNMPAADVPVGPDAEANVELRKVGTPKKFSVSAEAAFRARRSARPDGFRDGGEIVGRALRGAEGPAGAARTRARRSSCSTCTPASTAIPRSTRRCWCVTTPCSAPRNCRSLEKINFTGV